MLKIVTSFRYVRVLAISLPPYAVFQVLCKFLQTQGLNNDILLSSFAGVIVHAAVVYVLVFQTPLGYIGAAWATTITLVALDAILFTIIIKKCVFFGATMLRCPVRLALVQSPAIHRPPPLLLPHSVLAGAFMNACGRAGLMRHSSSYGRTSSSRCRVPLTSAWSGGALKC